MLDDIPPDLGQEARIALKLGGKEAAKLTAEQREFLLYDRVLHPAWYEKVKETDKWGGVDGVIAGGDGLVKRKGGYQKGMAALKQTIKQAESKGNIGERTKNTPSSGGGGGGGGGGGEGVTNPDEEGQTGVLVGPDGQEMCVVRERPDPEKPAFGVLLLSGTRKMIRTALRHQKDGHDPNLTFVFLPPPNLIFKREDLILLMSTGKPPPKPLDVDDTRTTRLFEVLNKYAPPTIHEEEVRVDIGRRLDEVGRGCALFC